MACFLHKSSEWSAGWGDTNKISIKLWANCPVDILTAWFKKEIKSHYETNERKKDRKIHIACVRFPVISGFSTNPTHTLIPSFCPPTGNVNKSGQKKWQTQEPHSVTENVSTPAPWQAASCQTKTVKLFKMSCSARFFPNHRQRAHQNVFFLLPCDQKIPDLDSE